MDTASTSSSISDDYTFGLNYSHVLLLAIVTRSPISSSSFQ
ncbi:uncharacterized protein RSE6_12984 [Rhynchosporium secalis]|uniref:Uncharacterized protein n=1 Tax=Rhynchosporium secalis TaxID=38038 RepID=A0A1E1MRT9_RHYSE|nr:uncharacterized protein RSE6_12984 [Rhynchosporium secalis]